MRHSNIQFGKNTVTKTTAPELMRVEVEKNRRAFKISKECGLFCVPEVLDYDETKGVAVFERIKNIQPIQGIIFKTSQIKCLMERVGTSLAIIHQRLILPYEMSIALPSEFDLPGTEVFLHGDFTADNICFQKRTSMIFILDWQMTARHGGQATYGSRYFDLFWLMNHMIWAPKLRYLLRDPVTPITKFYIESYFTESGITYDEEMLVRYAKGFFERKLPFRKQNATRMTRHLLPLSRVLTQRFIESLKKMASK